MCESADELRKRLNYEEAIRHEQLTRQQAGGREHRIMQLEKRMRTIPFGFLSGELKGRFIEWRNKQQKEAAE